MPTPALAPRTLAWVLALAPGLVLGGCGSPRYRATPEARFEGALEVRWIKNDYFVFVPNPDEPFALVRANGSRIQPGPIYTDGGSLPRFLWGVKGYSPWGYAPAYVVHDWLFEEHRCNAQLGYSFEDSVQLMAEGLKAVMEAAPEVKNGFVFESVVAAVESPIARRLWEQGACNKPPTFSAAPSKSGMPPPPSAPAPGELLMTIRFK